MSPSEQEAPSPHSTVDSGTAAPDAGSPFPLLHWTEGGAPREARWRSENHSKPPKRVVVADDLMTADTAFRLASEGVGLLWRGDFQNARQLMQAIARRVDRNPAKPGETPAESFRLHRQTQSQRARTLGMLLLQFEADHTLRLRRAPEVASACREVYGVAEERYVASLRELLGLVGAHEWRKKGVEVPTLGVHIHPHYGVFSPVRGEYLTLLAQAALPTMSRAFDIGTGTGVVAALLIKRGVAEVVATDLDERALTCAAGNFLRLGISERVRLEQVDLFPEGEAALVVCNPPWIPARPNSSLEHAIYDPGSKMLKGFLGGLGAHLSPGGEGWLILSDIAEHLGLRTRAELLAMIEGAHLKVLGRIDTRASHPKKHDASDPLHRARAAEITSLWRLTHAPGVSSVSGPSAS